MKALITAILLFPGDLLKVGPTSYVACCIHCKTFQPIQGVNYQDVPGMFGQFGWIKEHNVDKGEDVWFCPNCYRHTQRYAKQQEALERKNALYERI